MRVALDYLIYSFLWMVLLKSSLVQACDHYGVNQCVALLNSTDSTKLMNGGLTAIPPTEVLISLCRVHPDFKACYDPLAASCKKDPNFSMTFGVINATLSYLCSEGQSDILKHESCWRQSGVTSGTSMCHAQQTEMMSKLVSRTEHVNFTDIRTEWCLMLQNMSDCMTDVVAEYCGGEPACIMRTMMSKASEGLADFMGCSLKSDCLDLVTPRDPVKEGNREVTPRNPIEEGNRDKLLDTIENRTPSLASTSVIYLTLGAVLYLTRLLF